MNDRLAAAVGRSEEGGFGFGPLPPPPLPPGFAPRLDIEEDLASLVGVDTGNGGHSDRSHDGAVWSIRGQGGLGKTVAIAGFVRKRHSELRKRFPDGILWVTLGEEISAATALQAALASGLGRTDGDGAASLPGTETTILCYLLPLHEL